VQLTIVPAETGWGESGCSTGNNAQYLEKKKECITNNMKYRISSCYHYD